MPGCVLFSSKRSCLDEQKAGAWVRPDGCIASFIPTALLPGEKSKGLREGININSHIYSLLAREGTTG